MVEGVLVRCGCQTDGIDLATTHESYPRYFIVERLFW